MNSELMTTAKETPTTENAGQQRARNGRFAKGNRGGPGNPFAQQTARLRQAALDAVSQEDIQATFDALKKKSTQGDVPAAKLLLSYSIMLGGQAPSANGANGKEDAAVSKRCQR